MVFFVIYGAIVLVINYVVAAVLYRKSSYYKVTHKSYYDMRRNKGSRGEHSIYTILKNYENKGARFLFNSYVPKENGETTEIDLLMIYRSGIYVIESKNYKGWIFGNSTSKTWTQTLAQGRDQRARKEHFPNPILQNKSHIKYLKEVVGSQIPIHSLVVFSNNCTFKDVNVNEPDVRVIYRCGTISTIEEMDSGIGSKLTDSEIKEIYDKLFPYTQVGDDVKLKHIADINRQVYGYESGQTEQPNFRRCPRCGGNLVVRVAKKGNNAGNKFYGCSNYPRCRYTKNY